jgi:hypothetical protein
VSLVTLRRLTPLGVREFEAFLHEAHEGNALSLPVDILDSESLAEPISGTATVDSSRVFRSRQELGQYICEVLKGAILEEPEDDFGLWTWLAAVYLDQICPISNGVRKVGELARYVFNEGSSSYNYRRASRHLVFGPTYLIMLHGEHAPKCALVQRPDIHPDMAEQLASVQSLVSLATVMQCADVLYFDMARQRVRSGATDRKQPGTIRRLLAVCAQLDLTHDLASMSPEALLRILPAEFGRWRSPLHTAG